MGMTPEGKVKARLKANMKARFPDHYSFMPVQTGYGAATLDVIYCIEGFFVSIETKANGGKVTARQAGTMGIIRKAEGIAIVVDEQNVDLVGDIIRAQINLRKIFGNVKEATQFADDVNCFNRGKAAYQSKFDETPDEAVSWDPRPFRAPSE